MTTVPLQTPLTLASATITTGAAPSIGKINLYDATSGALTPTLPALSGLNAGARLAIRKIDTSANTVTFTCAGSDTTVTGGTSVVLRLKDDQVELQAVAQGAGKSWAYVDSSHALTSMDGRYYQKPSSGIPESDLASALQAKIDSGGSAYTKPSGGIPESDLASALQTKIDSATGAGTTPYLNGNIATDPGFENSYRWNSLPSGYSLSTAQKYTGTQSLKVVASGSSSGVGLFRDTSGTDTNGALIIDPNSNARFTFSAMVYRPSTNTGTGSFLIGFQVWDSLGVNATQYGPSNVVAQSTLATNTWTEVTFTGVIPEGYDLVQARVGIVSSPTIPSGDVLYFDAVDVRKVGPALVIDPTLPPYNIKMDRHSTTQYTMSSTVNPYQFTITGYYTLSSADVGKVIKVTGAGAAGGDLKTTITAVTSSTTATLASPCLTSITSTMAGQGLAIFGTDNGAALNALFADLDYTGVSDEKISHTAVFPAGCAMYSGTLYFPNGGTVKGAPENYVDFGEVMGGPGVIDNSGPTMFYQIWDQNVDCARIRDNGFQNWNAKYEGFIIEQDQSNTAGRGLSFRTSSGTAVNVIEAGTIDRVAVLGAAQAGFEFAGGVGDTAYFTALTAYANGYKDRVLFTANTTSGSATLSSVSTFTGLAVGDILMVPGVPIDSTIVSMNSGAGTLVMSVPATATATGVSAQRMGSPGIWYYQRGDETVHFDAPCGDSNSGGLIRITGNGYGGTPSFLITNLKNEYGPNHYYYTDGGSGALNQAANAVVLDNIPGALVSVRGLGHWADGASSVGSAAPYTNPLGKDIGAAILVVNTSSNPAPAVSWEALHLHLAAGSGQTAKYAFRDNTDTANIPAIVADSTGRGTNRPKNTVRLVGDTDIHMTAQDMIIGFTALSAPRVVYLPILNTVPVGQMVTIADISGSASATNYISASHANPGDGAGTLLGSPTSIVAPYGSMSFISNGSAWISSVPSTAQLVDLTSTQTLTHKTLTGPRLDSVIDTNGNQIVGFNTPASAVNYLQISNRATGGTPSITPVGPDTDISLTLNTKGAGTVQANGVPVATTTGAQTISSKTITSSSLTSPKIDSICDTNGVSVLSIGTAASAVNYVTATNSATGTAPTLTASGSDTDVSLNLAPKGAGTVQAGGLEVVTISGAQTLTHKTMTGPRLDSIIDTNGNQIVGFNAVGSAVNYVQISNRATGGTLSINSIGTDTDISLTLNPKGAGTLQSNSNPVGIKVAAPSTATSTGVLGQWAADSSYVYVCTATNTWKRAAIAAW